jgi:hypothetical protein
MNTPRRDAAQIHAIAEIGHRKPAQAFGGKSRPVVDSRGSGRITVRQIWFPFNEFPAGGYHFFSRGLLVPSWVPIGPHLKNKFGYPRAAVCCGNPIMTALTAQGITPGYGRGRI